MSQHYANVCFKELELQNTSLTQVSTSFKNLINLKELDLTASSIDCTCDLTWMNYWMTGCAVGLHVHVRYYVFYYIPKAGYREKNINEMKIDITRFEYVTITPHLINLVMI